MFQNSKTTLMLKKNSSWHAMNDFMWMNEGLGRSSVSYVCGQLGRAGQLVSTIPHIKAVPE